MKAYLSFASHVSQPDDEKVEKKLYSFVGIDRWRFGGLRGTQRPNMGAGDLQNTAMERRDGAALGNPYPRSSCACQVGVGRLQLQRIAVETTLRSAARSRQLPTATRVIWERAMGCRGAPRRATSAARAARPPAARIRAHGHHHVAKKLCHHASWAPHVSTHKRARCSLKPHAGSRMLPILRTDWSLAYGFSYGSKG